MVMPSIQPFSTSPPQSHTNHKTLIPRRRGLCRLNEDARDRVVQFIGLAHSLARHHRHQKARDIPMEELRAEALLALSYAAGRFDKNRGVPFGAYATMVIRHRLSQMVGVWRRSQKGLCYNNGCSEVEDQYLYDVPDPNSIEVDEGMASNELLVLVRSHLPARWFEILWLHYSDGLTLEEIGKSQSVSKQRICQLVEKAIRRARRKILSGLER